jgi:DNA-binding GntR family transcriptional regulator
MTPTASRFKPRALYEEVAEALRERIFNGALKPGDWVDELALAEEFGISRTPLREAIKVLAAEGLITMKLRRGAYVTEVDEQELAEIYHLMALLESDAAATVAAKASTAELAELKKLHQHLESSAGQDIARFFAANEAFHMRLLQLSSNRWRDQIVADLRKVMKLSRAQSLLKPGRIKQSLAEHAAIMRALHKRDSVVAAAAMRNHINSGLEAAA